jgi:long-chain acyl-CoA synthetase
MPLHEYLRLHARLTPEKTAIVWYGYEMSYAELDRLTDNCAAFLYELGVRKGEPVALFMQNCCQYVIAHFGIQKLGAIVSPCSPLFKHHELGYQLQDLGARVIIAAQDLLPIVQAARPQSPLEHVILTRYSDFLPEVTAYTAPDDIQPAMPINLEGVRDFCTGRYRLAGLYLWNNRSAKGRNVELWKCTVQGKGRGHRKRAVQGRYTSGDTTAVPYLGHAMRH